jgi:hypothetical protein
MTEECQYLAGKPVFDRRVHSKTAPCNSKVDACFASMRWERPEEEGLSTYIDNFMNGPTIND